MTMKVPLIIVLSIISVCLAQHLPYQSHSFNDLDYILQQLIKGVDAFKLDVNAVNSESCLQYSTWTKNQNKCYRDGKAYDICCLGFRGDTSSGPRLNDYFNTTIDFVNLLSNQKYDFIWQKEKRLAAYNRTIYIAMNIQFSDYSGGIVKDWLASMINTVQNRNLDVQFILGSSGIVDYFANQCASGSSSCDSASKTIIGYNWVLQSSSQALGALSVGTCSNFNIEFPSLPKYCSSFFPAYGESTPYFFYEIAHEIDAQFIANTYMSSTCNRTAGHPDLSSVRITSNIDPEMLQSYLPSPTLLKGIEATNVLTDVLIENTLMVLSYFDTTQKVTVVQFRSLAASNFMSVAFEQKLDATLYTKLSYKAPYLLLQSQSASVIYLVNVDSGAFALKSLYNVAGPALDADIVTYNDDLFVIQVGVQGTCQGNALSFTVTSLLQENIVLSQCSSVIQSFDIHEIQSASLSLAVEGSSTLRGILFVSANYVNFSQKDAIFAFILNADLSTLSQSQTLNIQVPQKLIDYGVDPSAKIVEDNGVLYVLEAHSNGLCQCADFLNNGNVYKCGISGTTNNHIANLQNIDYMMNYNWGRLNDFEDRVRNGRYVNSCDRQIMHAKFYNGNKPSGIVFRDNTSGVLQALIVNEFVDYDELPIVTKLFCGATMPTDKNGPESSVVANIFNLVDFSIFNSL